MARSALMTPRAQRLSASPRRRGGRFVEGDAGLLCSTPFGITASPRVRAPSEITEQGVLNAFRHHRVAEDMPPSRGMTALAVLNAFRHHRVAEEGHVVVSHRARLVLNAFRHHRVAEAIYSSACTTARCAQRLLASPRRRGSSQERAFSGLAVLNAFRHHRVAEESAPRIRSPMRHVLNAFRHHRVAEGPCPRCKTHFSRAQRLSASPRRRGGPMTQRALFDLRAQRLSASPRRRGRAKP